MSTTEMIEVPAGAEGDYVLRLRGDSMADAGMFDGDNLIVKTADSAQDGQIVVATVDGAATVTRWPTEFEGDVRVVGLVVGLFRSVETAA